MCADFISFVSTFCKDKECHDHIVTICDGEQFNWLTEILGLENREVSFLLQLSPKTISRYRQKFRTLGNINSEILGRPYASISIHPHEELVIMELVLQNPEKTIVEILEAIYAETGSTYVCSTLYYYLKRNNITRKKVGMPIICSEKAETRKT